MTDSTYISRDDETEAAIIAQQQKDFTGIGVPTYLTDEDVKTYSLNDFGIAMEHIQDLQAGRHDLP